MAATLAQVEQQPDQLVAQPYSRKLLVGGIVGRIWLWFVAGCLAVTIVPMIFGWRPYVIESGSMQPRIKVGDIVIASPNHNPQQLLGHVTVFQDPDFPGKVKTHRVVQIAKDGRLVTKGDANPTVDSHPVRVDKVQGIGRLMVRYAGRPLVWAQTGQWLYLFLFVLSLYLAAVVVVRDREPYEDDDLDNDENSDGEDALDGAADARATVAGPRVPQPRQSPEQTAAPVAEAPSEGGKAGPRVPHQRRSQEQIRSRGFDRRALKRAGRKLLFRSTALLGLAVILALPTARAAFASVTQNNTDTWAVPNWDYTTEAKALTPYIYYKLDEASPSTTPNDESTNNYDGTYNGNSTNFLYRQGGAFVSDAPNTGVTLRNNNACIYTPAASVRPASGPTTYSEIVWFKATAAYNRGGKLVGFETARTGVSDSNNGGQYDRHVYMDGNGHLWFGVWITASGTAKTITAATDYADNTWHMAVATMGAGGMRLYVDGVQQASDPNTVSETFANPGYWRFGCGNLSGWGGAGTWTGANAPTTQANVAFQGSLDEVAIYNTQLTAAQIAFLYWIR